MNEEQKIVCARRGLQRGRVNQTSALGLTFHLCIKHIRTRIVHSMRHGHRDYNLQYYRALG